MRVTGSPLAGDGSREGSVEKSPSRRRLRNGIAVRFVRRGKQNELVKGVKFAIQKSKHWARYPSDFTCRNVEAAAVRHRFLHKAD